MYGNAPVSLFHQRWHISQLIMKSPARSGAAMTGQLGCEQLVNILKIENFGVPHKITVQSMNKRTSYTDKFAEGTQKLSLSLKVWNILCWVVNNISEPTATTRAAQQ
jgi:hypothetical protein